MLIAGIAGFVLMLVYDVNSITIKNRLLHGGFFAGCLLVVGATAAGVWRAARAGAFSGDGVLLATTILWLAALIYCLFFALPFDSTYTGAETARPVYTAGVYALCRHPGVLCFWGLYLCLGLAALPQDLWKAGLVFCLLNTGYALFQDRVTFPRTLTGYEDYRRTTPFLFPDRKSISRAMHTLRNGKGEKKL